MKLPPYYIFPTISADKISLRQILKEDVEHLIEISFYDGIQATTLKQATEMLDKINKDYLNGNTVHWGIADNITNRIIGTCGYYRGFENRSGELGCVLLPQYQGKGFMTSAMSLAIAFGFKHMRLKRVAAVTTNQNLKAVKLLERLSFIKVAELEGDLIEYEVRQEDLESDQ
ncbi:MAG: GNAT family N-acetyltransferase [Bacteroidetes bacterium]|nr:GNAT family N-acetyltransferase [Bacteroidota bacterium]